MHQTYRPPAAVMIGRARTLLISATLFWGSDLSAGARLRVGAAGRTCRR
ncbi:MAG: hypothetical protein WDO13_11410 [Verrucomicrobiota bacterium]